MLDLDLPLTTLEGKPTTLRPYEGQVLLIVNVASQCGFTPQYEGLEALYRKYQGRGFSILGFPCDQFGGQEPGSSEEIRNFCATRFGVTFPLFEKVEVNGPSAHPLYRLLKKQAKGLLGTESIKWNFTKFLVDRHGRVVKRFGSRETPKSLEQEIERLL